MTKFLELEQERDLRDDERKILAALLLHDFPGVESLREQLRATKVSGEFQDIKDFTIRLSVPRQLPRAHVNRRIPVEAEKTLRVIGNFEFKLHMLLHVDDEGYLTELEIYADGDHQIDALPNSNELTIICLDWDPVTRKV